MADTSTIIPPPPASPTMGPQNQAPVPASAVQEHDGVNMHPMSVESKWVGVGAIIGLVAGSIFGYFEMKKRNGDWKYVAGFAALGLLLFAGLGCLMPARRKHVVKQADGKEVCYYSES